ncbi:hypothetical protein F66182_1321 [Fusarium sp. NRRL 66182]|nr:hypothetical protein F66182_1321 [Fusarium sp. NRRL 66182]
MPAQHGDHRQIEPRSVGTITEAAVFAEQTYAAACVDMLDIFTSCTNKIDGFTTLAFREQASCYCCHTSGRSLVWTDEMDSHASTCAEWASTGEPDTAYSVAKTFATFCSQFSDVCETSVSPNSITDDVSSATQDTESYTEDTSGLTIETVTGGDELRVTDSSSPVPSSSGLSTGAIAGIAVGVGLVALLALAGVFLWFLKRRRPPPPPPAQPAQPVQQVQQFGGNAQQQPYVMPHAQQPPYHTPQFYPDNTMYQAPPVYQPAPGTAPWPSSSPPAGQPVGQPAGQMQFAAELPTPDGHIHHELPEK